MHSWNLLFDVIVLLAGCLIGGGLMSRLGQSPLVGYLLVGMLIGGPGSMHLIGSEGSIEQIAELGVALLLFSLGLEFSIKRLLALGRRSLLGGLFQVISTVVVVALITSLFGISSSLAITLGAFAALSSTAIVLRVLNERSEMESTHGRTSLAVLLTQDMAVVPLAIIVSAMGGDKPLPESLMEVGRITGMALLLMGLLYILINGIALRTIGQFTLEKNRELSVLMSVVLGMGSAWAAHEVGISPALGAFVAGLFLGSSPFATQIRADVAPIKVVLLTLFFGAAGMVANPVWMFHNAGLVLLTTLGFLLLKTTITYTVLRLLGIATPTALATGLCLAQLGEFSFVLGSIAQQQGLVSPELYQLMVSVTILSLLVTPYLVACAYPLTQWINQRFLGNRGPSNPISRQQQQVDTVFIGFGPAAQEVLSGLRYEDKRVLVIDLNPSTQQAAEAYGLECLIGDATQTEVLEHAGVDEAKLIVITVPSLPTARLILSQVRHLAPKAYVIIRARYRQNRDDLVQAGAHYVFDDEQAVGYVLKQHLHEQRYLLAL